MVRKALASDADEVVIDLEDAVSPDSKERARAEVVSLLAELGETDRLVSVRVNGAGTPWSRDDLAAVATLRALPHSIVLPKVESPADVAYADAALADGNRAGPAVRIQALIESAKGLQNLDAIAGASSRMEALILGYADLAADLGRSPATDFWDPARERVLWAARACGLLAIDGPWLDVADDDRFRQEASVASSRGFDGKWVIHPRQIASVNRCFQPSDEQVAWAGRVLEAMTAAGRAGAGAVQLDGAMLDEAVAVRARRVLAAARAEQ